MCILFIPIIVGLCIFIFIFSKCFNFGTEIGSRFSNFNSSFSSMQGTTSGFFLRDDLDKIITNNKTNSEHIITVIYNEITATKEDELVGIKRVLDKYTDYEVSLDYDADGFINKVTISDI